ncbi:MAG: serine hydrolase domain-containing protein [Vicinamibacterales bacterium]
MNRARLLPAAVAAVLAVVCLIPAASRAQTLSYTLFDRYLEALRQQVGIPGVSVAVMRNGLLEWERGFGRQDISRNLPATGDTVYPIGGLTESMAATVLGLCAERGALDVDQPVQTYAPAFGAPATTVRDLLAHVSEIGLPGRFHYNPARYAALTPVLEACTGGSIRTALATEVFERLGMASSVPGADLLVPDNPARLLFTPEVLDRYADVLTRTAVPYRVDKNGKATPVVSEAPPAGLDAASGVLSTTRDLARYDAALDDAVLLQADTLAIAWRPAVVATETLPTGLGWFVQTYEGQRIVWQFSNGPEGYSGLVVKVPARRVTLIMLANSAGLASSASLETGDVTTSPFVRVFLRLFA